jgi:hypothetical protein
LTSLRANCPVRRHFLDMDFNAGLISKIRYYRVRS